MHSSHPTPSPEKLTPSRMSQLGTKKSRRGCVRCKQRRVKCDERLPCTNCVRRQEECSLLEPSPSVNSTASYDPTIPSNDEEWINDLELMHHYSSNTASGLNAMTIRPETHLIWSTYIPQQAIKHRFLMHGILALSALHLAYLKPSDAAKYLQLCDKHQTVALGKFRSILSSSDIEQSELADALFALSSVLSVSSMARSCLASDGAIDIDSLIELIWLTKGVRDVTVTLYEQIKSGPMLAIFHPQDVPDDGQVILPTSISTRLTQLRSMLRSLDSSAQDDCEKAIAELERIYRTIQYFSPTAQIEPGPLYRWMVDVPNGYVRLVQARNPAALIILAFYATTFTSIRRSWFEQNFAGYTLRGISLELEDGMQHWLAWPRLQLDERLQILGARPQEGESREPRPLIGF